MEESVPEAEDLMRPREVAERNKNKEEVENGAKEQEEEEKGPITEILNNLISNFIGPTSSVDGKSDENVQKIECENEDEKKKESSSAGILEKIISHLPEDAVPTTEEASILIHSVID